MKIPKLQTYCTEAMQVISQAPAVHKVSILSHTGEGTLLVQWKTEVQLYFVQCESNVTTNFNFSIAAKVHLLPCI